MTIIAITAYAGSEPLVAMTERMLEQFTHCALKSGEPVITVAVRNGAVRKVASPLAEKHIEFEGNLGFGRAINAALCDFPNASHALLLNNDLEFPQREWLKNLLAEREGDLILTPRTDRTGAKIAVADGPTAKPPIRAQQVSAFCWLVPMTTIKKVWDRFGFPLFDPEFFCYGEDDFTGAIFRKLVHAKPFKVVPSAWVKHLRNQTGKEMGLHGGMAKNLDLLNRKLKTHALR